MGNEGKKDGTEVEDKKHLGLMWKDQVYCGLTCEKRSVPGRLVKSKLTGNHCNNHASPLYTAYL